MRYVEVRDRFKACHCWPKAPERCAFLRTPHPHTFRVTVRLGVGEGDREVEFYYLREALEHITDEMLHRPSKGMTINGMDMGSTSCEEMAEYIAEALRSLYPQVTYLNVSVFEDDEQGAGVEVARLFQEDVSPNE